MPDDPAARRAVDPAAQEWLAKALAHFLFGYDNLGDCARQQREAALGWAEEWMEKPGNEPPLRREIGNAP